MFAHETCCSVNTFVVCVRAEHNCWCGNICVQLRCGVSASGEDEKCINALNFSSLARTLAQKGKFYSISALCAFIILLCIVHCYCFCHCHYSFLFFLFCSSRLLRTKFNQATITECFREYSNWFVFECSASGGMRRTLNFFEFRNIFSWGEN